MGKISYILSSGKPQFFSKDFRLIEWGPPLLKIIYLKSTDYRWYPHPQNTFTTIPRLMSNRITGYYRLVKLTHKTNHHHSLLVNLAFIHISLNTLNHQKKTITESYFHLTWHTYPAYNQKFVNPFPRSRCKVLGWRSLFFTIL